MMPLAEVFHPGEYLGDELRARNMEARVLAAKSGVPYLKILDLLARKIGIDKDMADKFSRELGTSAEYWMNLQKAYDTGFGE